MAQVNTPAVSKQLTLPRLCNRAAAGPMCLLVCTDNQCMRNIQIQGTPLQLCVTKCRWQHLYGLGENSMGIVTAHRDWAILSQADLQRPEGASTVRMLATSKCVA